MKWLIILQFCASYQGSNCTTGQFLFVPSSFDQRELCDQSLELVKAAMKKTRSDLTGDCVPVIQSKATPVVVPPPAAPMVQQQNPEH